MTMQEINKQYQALCEQLGDVNYKIKQHIQLQESIYLEMDKLNNLASILKQSEISNTDKKLKQSEISNTEKLLTEPNS